MSGERDPERLSEAAPDSALGQLLASAKQAVPSDAELASLAERLGGVLGPAPAPVASGSSLAVKLGAVIGVAALVAGGLWAFRRPHSAALAPSKPTASAPVVTLPPNVTPAPVAPARSSATAAADVTAPLSPAVVQKPSGPAQKLTAAEGPSEPVLLEQARRALASSPATALALTAQHAARFPHGVLAQEREVIAIEALRRLGRGAEADRRAAAFAQAFPGSAHQRMVEDAAPK